MGDERSVLYDDSTRYQKFAACISVIAGVLGLILLITWTKTETTKAGLGGYDWEKLIFNYHPTFMYSALILGSCSAIVSYRLLPFAKYVTKTIHVILHTAAIGSIVLGLSAVILGNNYKSHSPINSYSPNFFSLHSFIGIGAVGIYVLNYTFGLIHFLPPLMPMRFRAAYMPYHIFFGTFAVVGGGMAVMTGIMELSTSLGCEYTVHHPDTNPVKHYALLPYGCRLANGVGICVYIVILTLLFGITRFFRLAESFDESLLT